jgi:hypothetical protein
MKDVWTWAAGIVVGLCILGLMIVGRPARHHHRAAYVVVRSTTGQQAQTKAPPGNWLLIRRIPRP